MRHVFELDGTPHEIGLVRQDTGWWMEAGGSGGSVDLDRSDGCVLVLDGIRVPMTAAVEGDVVHLSVGGRAYALRYRDPVEFHAAAGDAGGHDVARAPMPGMVLTVAVRPGDPVQRGDTLMVIESMKMETAIKAVRAGTVEAVHVGSGQSFDRDTVLVTLADAEG